VKGVRCKIGLLPICLTGFVRKGFGCGYVSFIVFLPKSEPCPTDGRWMPMEERLRRNRRPKPIRGRNPNQTQDPVNKGQTNLNTSPRLCAEPSWFKKY
jgi:hypothetical protein